MVQKLLNFLYMLSYGLLASWYSLSLLSFANLLAYLFLSMLANAQTLYSDMDCVCCILVLLFF